MSADKILYYYHGDEGEYIAGVPTTDLTQADWDFLSPNQKYDVMNATVARGDKRALLYTTSKAEPKAVAPVPPEPVEDAPSVGEEG